MRPRPWNAHESRESVTTVATVDVPLYCRDTRWYIVLRIGSEKRVCKVPYRYNRVMCTVTGDKTIHELVEGDTVTVTMNYSNGGNKEFIGAWVLSACTFVAPAQTEPPASQA